MTRFRYVGDKDETYVFGRWFRQGKAVEVQEQSFINKLRGNPFFEEVKARRKPAEVIDVDPDE